MSAAYANDYATSRKAELAMKAYLESRYLNVERAPEDVALPWDLKVHDIGLVLEVKVDRYAGVKSQNVAIEVAYKGNPSGLTTTEASMWCIFIKGQCWTVKTETLRELIKGRKTIMGGDYKASEMVLLPIDVLRPHAFIYPESAVAL